jgi:hypothetical protein
LPLRKKKGGALFNELFTQGGVYILGIMSYLYIHKIFENMSVLAKFKCNFKTDESVVLSPVYSSDPESINGQFFKYTPWGKIEMGILNPDALEQFEEQEEYFVTFTKASKDGN